MAAFKKAAIFILLYLTPFKKYLINKILSLFWVAKK